MNWLKKAQQARPDFFDDGTEAALGGFSDTCNGRLITRQTGRSGTVRYHVDDNGTPHVVYQHWRGDKNKIEDANINVAYVNGRWYRVDLATGELGQEYNP